MDAGQLNQLASLQRLATGQDAVGQPVQTWQSVQDVWADVRFVSGLEAIKAGGEMALRRASVRIRYRDDVTSAMRLVAAGVALQIKSVLPNQQRGYLDLVCEAME